MMNANLVLAVPELVACAVLGFHLILELLKKSPASRLSWTSAYIGAALILVSLLPFVHRSGQAFAGFFILDPLAVFFKIFFAATVLVILPMSRGFFSARRENPVEFLMVLWCSLIGLFFLASANDLLMMFIALETFTLCLYILASYLKTEMTSIESGLKYLIIGSLASAFVIFGISMIYVGTGTTNFGELRIASSMQPSNQFVILGILLMLSGFGFKAASVPFQLWVPDVYQGAPTPVVAYLSVASKAAGFVLLLRIFFTVFPGFDSARQAIISVLAALSILYGNLGALLQKNMKRLLGYSSIGHAGYLLIGVALGKEAGVTAVLFYFIAYAFANLAVFTVITAAGSHLQNDSIDAFRGLSKRSPFLAGCLFLALLSLAGVPPLAGFFGKFLVLLAAVKGNAIWLALVGLLAVSVSLYYYLSIVRVMYFNEPSGEARIQVSAGTFLILLFLAAGIIIAGFWQAPFLAFARFAAASLF